MWAFKTLWDKGLVYEGFRVLAYCWRCETPLRNTETRMDDVYRDRQDPALTVWFEARRRRRSGCWRGRPRRGRCRPTSPSPSVPTSTTPSSRTTAGSATCSPSARLGAYERELGDATRRRPRCTGTELVGRALRAAVPVLRRHRAPNRVRSRCSPPTSCRPRRAPASCTWRPGFGEDDQMACNAAGIPTRRARWTSTAATPPRSRRGRRARLRRQPATSSATSRTRGVVVRHETYDHSYPHCWRCASRSCTGRSRRGSCRSPSSATGWSS